jgi:phosphoadenosine phosphosulfate reductase
MALYRNGAFVADDWTFPADDEAIPGAGAIALSRARLIAEWPTLASRNAPVGLVLASGEKVDGLEEILPRLALVRLVIPRYSDGRLYSQARLLRERHGFAGEIRAAGDILRDQIVFLARVGFDAFEITHEGTIKALAEGKIVSVGHFYQPAATEASETRPGPRPWLRQRKAGAVL